MERQARGDPSLPCRLNAHDQSIDAGDNRGSVVMEAAEILGGMVACLVIDPERAGHRPGSRHAKRQQQPVHNFGATISGTLLVLPCYPPIAILHRTGSPPVERDDIFRPPAYSSHVPSMVRSMADD